MMDPYPAKNLYHGSVAARYDEERFVSPKGKWLDKREKQSVTKALQWVDKQSTVLDLPCGTGRITEHLLRLGYRVAAADLSTDMIALARQRIGNNNRLFGYYQLDAERIALATNSYDCVTSVRLMGHLPPAVKLQVLREMARVARNFLVVTFYRAGPVRSLKWLLTRHSRMRRAQWYPVTHRGLRDLFDASGLTPLAYCPVFPVLSDGVTCLLRVGSD